ncbi:MAG: hypothetical protein IKD89_06205 [Clostridia bacterium]|nr:hypothetical protein [Clostridia bacterium]
MAKKFISASDLYRAKNRSRKGSDIGGLLKASSQLVDAFLMGPSKKRKKKTASKKKTKAKNSTAGRKNEIRSLNTRLNHLSPTIIEKESHIAGHDTLHERTSSKEHEKEIRILSQEEIEALHIHLERIDIYKDIANTSSDPRAVGHALDELLKSIDYIMTYSEGKLNQAGMSKVKLPAQREFIVQNYDVMIAQASAQAFDGNEEITTKSENI